MPDADEFAADRASLARSRWLPTQALRQQAVDLQVAAEGHHYTYQWEWAGVPIIRIPDDVMVLQELFWAYRPQRVVETGVARGGSMLLNASLMRLTGESRRVLGIDHKLYPHTTTALREHPLAGGVELLEADSTSDDGRGGRSGVPRRRRAAPCSSSTATTPTTTCWASCARWRRCCPSGGCVLVADTLVEEFPEGHYAGRPWDRGDNPLTAVRAFLAEHDDFEAAPEWGRRALVSEFRDGILRRV